MNVLSSEGCLASNKNALYFVTSVQRNKEESVVLLRSNSTTADTTSWDIISTVPISQVVAKNGPNGMTPHFYRSSCIVDEDGVFHVRGLRGDMATYNPMAPLDLSAKTCNVQGVTKGEWSTKIVRHGHESLMKESVLVRAEAASGNHTSDPLVVFVDETLPKIEYAAPNNALKTVQVLLSNRTNLEILSLHYGDGRMFAVLRTNPSETTRNQTLVHFPFEPPYNLSGIPESIVNVPWGLDCDFSVHYTEAAVAKGKFYYLCHKDMKEGISHLYVYDSKTGQTQGPQKVYGCRDVPRHSSSGFNFATRDGEPTFVTFHQSYDAALRFHLPIAQNKTADYFNVTGEMPSIEAFEEPCGADKASDEKVIGASLAAVAVGLALVAGFIFWKKKKGTRKMADASMNDPPQYTPRESPKHVV
ncbi:hypothetical protein BGZ82_009133 [Podila clonocystis]|nr:hypothetical protein BGZ82_009133 [Podila clonocystis]